MRSHRTEVIKHSVLVTWPAQWSRKIRRYKRVDHICGKILNYLITHEDNLKYTLRLKITNHINELTLYEGDHIAGNDYR